jgi:hypothetical protein
MASAMAQRRAGIHHQKLAQIAVAHLCDARPSRVLPPVEFWRGVRPRKAANSRPLMKAPASWIVATIADAVTGPTPGMVINRLAVSSALTDAANPPSSNSLGRPLSHVRSQHMTSGLTAFCAAPHDARRCPMSETRKIAEILVGDIVGYSPLAGASEGSLRIPARAVSLCLLPHCDADHTDEADSVLSNRIWVPRN